ncbi:biotin/lipoyl-binding protein, partial [Alteromonas sp. AMM-1]|uniref:biotin/lipoyl-binding protein n=1 Tax=Alteromonas sp. AMM-1 TaxID=3394233 RepID=UPI0039A4DF18
MKQTRVAVMCVLSVFVWACSQQDTSVVYGTVERDRVSVRATSAEVIESVHVTEGSTVQQGELLVSLNNARQQLVVNQAMASASQAKSALEKLLNGERMEDLQIARAELDKAKAQSQEKTLEFRRIKTLKEKALGTQAELDLALAALQTAQASENVAEQTLQKLVAGSRSEDIASAQALSDAANAKVDWEAVDDV